MGDPQRLNDTEQVQIPGLLEAASTDPSAIRAARALADLMRHLLVKGQPFRCAPASSEVVTSMAKVSTARRTAERS